jgi:hypothetical protein
MGNWSTEYQLKKKSRPVYERLMFCKLRDATGAAHARQQQEKRVQLAC